MESVLCLILSLNSLFANPPLGGHFGNTDPVKQQCQSMFL